MSRQVERGDKGIARDEWMLLAREYSSLQKAQFSNEPSDHSKSYKLCLLEDTGKREIRLKSAHHMKPFLEWSFEGEMEIYGLVQTEDFEPEESLYSKLSEF